MIDEDFRVWLIEANTNPYIGIPNSYIKDLLPKMLDEMFSLVLGSAYPCPLDKKRGNTFELIYCEKNSAHSRIPINIRRSYDKSLLYPPAKNNGKPEEQENLRRKINVDVESCKYRSGAHSISPEAKRHGGKLSNILKRIRYKRPSVNPNDTSLPSQKSFASLNNESTGKDSVSGQKLEIRPSKKKLEEIIIDLVKVQNHTGIVALFGRILETLKKLSKKVQINTDADIVNVSPTIYKIGNKCFIKIQDVAFVFDRKQAKF